VSDQALHFSFLPHQIFIHQPHPAPG
jgi:hypothetical protein